MRIAEAILPGLIDVADQRMCQQPGESWRSAVHSEALGQVQLHVGHWAHGVIYTDTLQRKRLELQGMAQLIRFANIGIGSSSHA